MKSLLGCLPFLCAVAAHAADLRMLADVHPPLQFNEGGELHGFGVDVVRELARRAGDTPHFEQLPLTRALREAGAHPDTGALTVLRTAEREWRYQWVGPLLETETALYSEHPERPPVTSLAQAAQAGSIVLPRKWQVYGYLRQRGLQNLYGVDTPEQMMQLLHRGRAELVVADTLTIATLAREAGIEPARLHYQMPLLRQGAYIVFSPCTDPQRVARWQAALEQLRREGGLQRLRERWQLVREIR